VTSLHAHQKINEKPHFYSSNLFKNKDFFKISKKNDSLNYLEKLIEQHFSKTLFDASESAKKHFSLHQKMQKTLFL
jgi:hypothetical protein